MLLTLLQHIRGYLRIRVSGYSTERFLNACRQKSIRLWNLTPRGNAYEMNITIDGFRRIRPVVKRTGVKVVIIERTGLPFFLHRYRKRRLFFVGFGLCILLIVLLSKFIWNIDISGNITRTDETLLAFLETQSVQKGMKISEVDCEQIVRDIRKEYDDIIWVSASIEGTRLIIQIKENEDSVEMEEDIANMPKQPDQPVDIIADIDCTITDIVMRRGISQIQEGAQVEEGDLLVSGHIPVKNDAGEIINYQYEESDADIRGQTTIEYVDYQSLTFEEKKLLEIKKEEYYMRIGDYRMIVGGIRNDYEAFEQYSKEIPLKLSENFYLPVSFGWRKVNPYETTEQKYTEQELQRALTDRFHRYCEDLEKKGVEIIENDVKIYTGLEAAQAKGTLVINMPVGEKKPSQRLLIPEKIEENEQSGEDANGNAGNNN